MTDERAISPVFGYALTLGIGTILIVGLVMAAGGHVETQRDQVMQNELEVIGGHVAADIAAADRVNRTHGTTEIAISRNLQSRVVGSPYRIDVRTDGDGPTDPYLELNARQGNLNVTVQVGVASQSPVRESSVDGGSIEVVYDEQDSELVVRNA